MEGDWTFHSRTFYQAAVLDAVVTSGLYHRLQRGVFETDLLTEGYRPEFLQPVLQLLNLWGFVEDQGANQWQWQGAPPPPEVGIQADHTRRWLELSRRLHPRNQAALPTTDAEQLLLERRSQALSGWLLQQLGAVSGEQWLDVGAGPGHLGRAMARVGARVTLADLPAVAERWNMPAESQMRVWGGDVFAAFPEGPFDGVLMARFIESYPPDHIVNLWRVCHRHLNPGGRLVVAGYFADGSEQATLFGLHVALHEPRGMVYPVALLTQMGDSAQLAAASCHTDPHTGYSLLILRKSTLADPPEHSRRQSHSPNARDDRKELADCRMAQR